MTSIPYTRDDVIYPDSDGRPMAESDFQREPLAYAVSALRRRFSARPDVYVSGNMLLYYEQGNPKACVAPDVFVVLGAPGHDRRSYKLWEEPKAPDFALEITSQSTVGEDQGVKRGLYAFLGVAEYWQYDPTGDYLDPPLAGLRLVDGNYWRIPVRTDAEGTWIGLSEVLGLTLVLDRDGFHFVDPDSGTRLPTYSESEQARAAAEQARLVAEQARLVAERERLAAEQERLAAEQALQEAEARAANEEALRRQAEQRIAELEARLRGDP